MLLKTIKQGREKLNHCSQKTKDQVNQVNLEQTKSLLMKDEKINSSRIATSSPKIFNN